MKQTYDVIIRSNIPDRELEFLRIFGYTITSPSGGADLRGIPCTRVDVSHHSYIEIETTNPDGELSVLKIPHHYVFLIVGSEEKPSIGYNRTIPNPS